MESTIFGAFFMENKFNQSHPSVEQVGVSFLRKRLGPSFLLEKLSSSVILSFSKTEV